MFPQAQFASRSIERIPAGSLQGPHQCRASVRRVAATGACLRSPPEGNDHLMFKLQIPRHTTHPAAGCRAPPAGPGRWRRASARRPTGAPPARRLRRRTKFLNFLTPVSPLLAAQKMLHQSIACLSGQKMRKTRWFVIPMPTLLAAQKVFRQGEARCGTRDWYTNVQRLVYQCCTLAQYILQAMRLPPAGGLEQS